MNSYLVRILSLCVVAFVSQAHAQINLMGQDVQPNRLDSLRYVDIRDLVTYGTDLRGTANLLMKALEEAPGRFVGEVSGNQVVEAATAVRFLRDGAKGPQGSTSRNEDGKKVFEISYDPVDTRLNTILSVEVESIFEEEYDKVFRLGIILFVHDSQNVAQAVNGGRYFRRMTVRVDWNAPNSTRDRVQVLSWQEDIGLGQTRFQLKGDLLERKVIVEEPNHRIYKVFPIAVGSFDVRTRPSMDGIVRLMTDEFPQSAVAKTTVLNTGPYGFNTRSRTSPSYFKGRPFIALFLGGETTYDGYREIGMHYQIDDSGLTRGFLSHGCIRVRDKDLYQLDAILNDGFLQTLPAHFVYNLQGYDAFEHPMPKADGSYNIVNYSVLQTEPVVNCKDANPYRVKWQGEYHTVADGDCLTLISNRSAPARDVINYMKGISTFVPDSLVSNREHVSVVAEMQLAGEQIQTETWEPEGGDRQSGFNLGFLFGGGNSQKNNTRPQGNVGGRDRVDVPERRFKYQDKIQNAQAEIAKYEQFISKRCGGFNPHKSCDQYKANLLEWQSYLKQLINAG